MIVSVPWTTLNRTTLPQSTMKKMNGAKKEENIYLGPHGAPPTQSKQQELNSSSRKQRFKQKLKEADRRNSGTGRENKLENLRELVGGGKGSSNIMGKGSPRDWLDPHCHESQLEKWSSH
ncbi:uncharacterized protein LOC110601865 isoform X2 [Manihot esculenta]|uniref:Uncharacterized protein n=1 Tax=Manihot esculenta TaxID=3983 RepID=A0A2C9UD94_MANES|nr:uncharacterized protein LOC110601865 isoform X2 [Manihot esculenta]